MTLRHCFVLPLVLLAQAGCVRTGRPPLARAAEYLWSQQAQDGGWHSHTYGLLRSGQSLTPFVVEALLEIPPEVYPVPQARLDRALAFLHSKTQPDGALGMADPGIPDYPNYSTALAVSALSKARQPGWEMQVQPMLVYLRAQQFTEQNGWHPADAVYGAWGMGGGRRTPPDTGHVDLSMTRYVMQALRDAGVPSSDAAFQQALVFLERCQNFDPEQTNQTDGGFFLQPPNSTPTKPVKMASDSAATEPPRPTAFWRCWPRGFRRTIPAFPQPSDGSWPVTKTWPCRDSWEPHTNGGRAGCPFTTPLPRLKPFDRYTSRSHPDSPKS